jgi:hypothetical protein
MGILAIGKGTVSKREAGWEVNSELIERFCRKGYIGGASNNAKEE